MMKRIFLIFTFLGVSLAPLLSQERAEADNFVRLISAGKATLLEIDGKPYRKIEGSAEFFHNNTRMLCDSAFWNVEEGFIDARGNVKVIQGNTILTGDSLHYIAEENTAKFRGTLVQLIDDDDNILRTNHLDYNLKDSIAYFFNGGSMKDREGNIIESDRGVFNSKISHFTFIDTVQMFSDSLFFVSDSMVFQSDINTAFFGKNTKGWKDNNYLSSNGGWYDQQNDKIFFEKSVYVQTLDYEVWSEALFYDRVSISSKLNDDIQVLDTINNTIILGDQLIYEGSSKYTEITQKPVLVGITGENDLIDSLFMTADSILYYTVMMCNIDSTSITLARERRKLADIDVFENARTNMKKAAEAAAAAPTLGRLPGALADASLEGKVQTSSIDSLTMSPRDTSQMFFTDSLVSSNQLPLDTVPKIIPPDSTEVKFIEAYHGVRLFKSDLQMLCDSLIYTGIDSIARLYKDPVLWNDITNQFTADSIQLVVVDGQMEKGYLLSNAFVIAEDIPTYYNQIRAPEMVSYFDEGELYRYDAMGGVSSILYLEQDSVVSTVLVRETKVMSARLQNGDLERVYNLEAPKSDAYPIYDLSLADQRLKGFNLREAERPANRDSITTRKIRKSIRKKIENAPTFPIFNSTAEYFPNYMDSIFFEINHRTPIKWRRTDSTYLKIAETTGILEDRAFPTPKRELVRKEDVSSSIPVDQKELDESQVLQDESKADSVKVAGADLELGELSKEEVKANLKEERREERIERKLAKRKKSITRKLKREERRRLKEEKQEINPQMHETF